MLTNVKVCKRRKDSVEYRLLECSYQWGVMELDIKGAYKHLANFCSCQLHKWITTSKCDLEKAIKTCVQASF
jgi:hypothetical protein